MCTMEKKTITISAPSEEWIEAFLIWLTVMLKDHYNDQDQFGVVQQYETGKVIIYLSSLDAR